MRYEAYERLMRFLGGVLLAAVVALYLWLWWGERGMPDHRYYEPDMIHPIGS